MNKKETNSSKKKEPQINPEITSTAPPAGKFLSSFLRFERFGWDIFGIILITSAIVLLAGLLGLTGGFIITPIVRELSLGLGWGIYLAIALLFLFSYIILKRSYQKSHISLGQILALEGWLFVIVALLAELGGHSLERAESGQDGGVIGWGLAEFISQFLPSPLHIGLLLGFFVFLPVYGFGIHKPLVAIIEDWLRKTDDHNDGSQGLEKKPVLVVTTDSAVTITTAKKRQKSNTLKGTADTKKSNRQLQNLPPYDLLINEQVIVMDEGSIHSTAQLIEQTLAEFGIPSRVVGYRVGPTVTQFAVEPGFIEKVDSDGQLVKHKVRVSQISGLGRDLALALSAHRLRIEAPVPGKSFVGIEVPNDKNAVVRLRPLLEYADLQSDKSPLTIALGKDVSGKPLLADLSRMPHLLIAGTTGSGKSVCIASITINLVMNNPPEDLRLVMLDPKKVELWRFNDLPHLIGKVENEAGRMLAVLRWALVEMDRRYRLLEQVHAKDLESYNQKMTRRNQETLPRIAIIIDELADLMMSVPDQTEHALVRLAQMARATGMHLVVATQRPSTDVVTGLIKANFPARISFSVASSIDSRVILDTNGAETLLGRGDMLFINAEIGAPVRAQGALVTDMEMDRIINYWRQTIPAGEPEVPWEEQVGEDVEGTDKLIDKAIEVVKTEQRASASLLQRRLRIGYPRAARLIDELAQMGIVGPSQTGGKDREVLIPPDENEDDGESE